MNRVVPQSAATAGLAALRRIGARAMLLANAKDGRSECTEPGAPSRRSAGHAAREC